MNPITKYIAIGSASLSLTITGLHHGSHAWLKLEEKAVSAYHSSKLGRYMDALQSYEDNGTAVIQKADTSSLIRSAASLYNVKPELIEALIEVESSGKPDAIAFNPEGDKKYGKMRSAAHGLMQVRGIHAGSPLCPEATTWSELYEPRTNIVCGTRILRAALDAQPTLRLALAEYNGGANCIKNKTIVCSESVGHSEKTMAALADRMYSK